MNLTQLLAVAGVSIGTASIISQIACSINARTNRKIMWSKLDRIQDVQRADNKNFDSRICDLDERTKEMEDSFGDVLDLIDDTLLKEKKKERAERRAAIKDLILRTTTEQDSKQSEEEHNNE